MNRNRNHSRQAARDEFNQGRTQALLDSWGERDGMVDMFNSLGTLSNYGRGYLAVVSELESVNV